MVPPASDKISRVSPYSGSRWASSRFRIRDLHPLRSAFQCRSPTMILAVSRSFNPRPRSGLGSSPFARRYSGNHCCFLFLRVLRCFSSRVPLSQTICSSADDTLLRMPGSPIRIPADLCLRTAPRRVSPFVASFFSFKCLGIHRTPFLT